VAKAPNKPRRTAVAEIVIFACPQMLFLTPDLWT
jgi:hypothetical protein